MADHDDLPTPAESGPATPSEAALPDAATPDDSTPSGAATPPARGPARPLLALAALIPLLAATAFLLTGTPPDAVTAEQVEDVAQPGAVEQVCPGPLQVPDDALTVDSDAELALTPPSQTADIGAVVLEPESNLLFGSATSSETLRAADGTVRTPAVTAARADGEEIPAQVSSQDLGAAVLQAPAAEDPALLTAATFDGGRPVADAHQYTATPAGDYRSLSLTRCATPSTSAAFLGASTSLGSSSVLTLTNPSTRPATASVQVWSPDGPAEMAGRSQIVVAPGEQEQLLLESIAPGYPALGVQVEVLGAPLSMYLQTTERDGLTPGGAEILAPLPPRATELTMPGVAVDGTPPTVMLSNPGGSDTTATLEVLGPDGVIEAATRSDLTVPAGTVLPVELDNVPAGIHTVRMTSQEPLLAVTRTVRAGAELAGDTIGTPVDLAVVEPARAIGSSAALSLPAGGTSGALQLSASIDTAVTVIPIAADGSAGEPIALDLVADQPQTVTQTPLSVGCALAAGLTIVPAEPGVVHAGWLQYQDDGAGGALMSTLAVAPAETGGDGITVRRAA